MKYFLIKLPNNKTLFCKAKSWSDLLVTTNCFKEELSCEIFITEIKFWKFLKKLLTN